MNKKEKNNWKLGEIINIKKEIVKKNMINAVLSGDENLKAFNE